MATITLHSNPLNTVGNLPTVGSQAPAFTVTKSDLSEISLQDCLGRRIVLNIFPSLDTPTCAIAMKRFNEIATKLPNTLILCVSADLPFAQKRFCGAEHLDNIQAVSVFRHPGFGQDYGVTIAEGPLSGLLSRAIVVLDETGKVIYTEQVKEIADEPDYNAVLEVLNS